MVGTTTLTTEAAVQRSCLQRRRQHRMMWLLIATINTAALFLLLETQQRANLKTFVNPFQKQAQQRGEHNSSRIETDQDVTAADHLLHKNSDKAETVQNKNGVDNLLHNDKNMTETDQNVNYVGNLFHNETITSMAKAKLQQPPMVNFNHSSAATKLSENHSDCQLFLIGNLTRFQVNQLRRNIFIYHPHCIDVLMPHFSRSFVSTPFLERHLMLHIPKAGGTSICGFLKQKQVRAHLKENNTAALTFKVEMNNNCWSSRPYGPLWCCIGESRSHSYSCAEQHKQLFQTNVVVLNPKRMFVPLRKAMGTHDEKELFAAAKKLPTNYTANFQMNENWLDADLCESQTQSILVREPISRGVSNIAHLIRSERNQGQNIGMDNAKVKLTLNNYMTWSLTAHRLFKEPVKRQINPRGFAPSEAHLEEAKHRLEQLDIVLDLSLMADIPMNQPHETNNVSCLDVALTRMGIFDGTAKLPRDNMGNPKSKSIDGWNMTEIEERNHLDIQLYEHAQDLIRADCDFLGRLTAFTKS